MNMLARCAENGPQEHRTRAFARSLKASRTGRSDLFPLECGATNAQLRVEKEFGSGLVEIPQIRPRQKRRNPGVKSTPRAPTTLRSAKSLRPGMGFVVDVDQV